MHRVARSLFVLSTLAGVTARPCPAAACAPAPPAGEQVTTQREDALIVWDAPSHREHFVRRALFGGVTKEFGFLVPTPSQPELAEVSEDVFSELGKATAPAVVNETRWVAAPVGCTMLPWLFLRAGSKASAPMLEPPPAVTVLDEARVAGLDATVLQASDAAALGAWLEARGFAFRPALKDWVEPYLRRGWKVSAFRYGGEARLPSRDLGSRALRMSFVTDTPIYPYREPEDQPLVPGRELRLFLLAPTQLQPVWPRAEPASPVSTRFSAPLLLSPSLGQAAPGIALNSPMWLVELRDPTRKRPPFDLSFADAPSPRELRPEPAVVYRDRPLPIPYEAPLLAGGMAWWWQRRRSRPAV